MRYYGNSDVGRRRSNNQDSFAVKEYDCGAVLGVVCDGMGGAHGGETASRGALESFVEKVDELMETLSKSGKEPDEWKVANVLLDAVNKANEDVFTKSRGDNDLEGMGTTLVSSLVFEDRIYTVNVGDSRMYLIDTGRIVQVTHDHSYVQYLVDIGKMTSEEAEESVNKNIITRAIGTEEEIEPDIYLTEITSAGDGGIRILLCTDGLTNHVNKDMILDTVSELSSQGADEKMIVDSLIERANENGGSDNITAVMITV